MRLSCRATRVSRPPPKEYRSGLALTISHECDAFHISPECEEMRPLASIQPSSGCLLGSSCSIARVLRCPDRRTSLVFELPPSADRQDCWHIYYGDVHAGTIAKRVGSPHVTDQWEWRCGFYPGSRPGEIRSGTAATFDYARDEFGGAWKIFFANRTDAGFQAWRHQRDWTERKYAIWKRGELLPSQSPTP